jgi:hypothetical protein
MPEIPKTSRRRATPCESRGAETVGGRAGLVKLDCRDKDVEHPVSLSRSMAAPYRTAARFSELLAAVWESQATQPARAPGFALILWTINQMT